MSLKRFLFTLIAALVLLGCYMAWDFYKRIYSPNVFLSESTQEFKIHSEWVHEDVIQALVDEGIVKDERSLRWVSERKNYPELVKAGRYIVLDGMSNNQLIDLLRSGEQEPLDVIVRSVRTKAELASQVGVQIEADSAEIMELLEDDLFCGKYGFESSTILCLFLPNTYEFYWNTSAEEFVVRMAREFKRFWNEERLGKANALGLSQSEVTVLASIVQAEQAAHPDERPVVAGLYLNRLSKGMRLESDPTLIHAIGDFTIKRVLNVHKEVDSPYNTYKRTGLPPGPILLPELSSMDAVLNAASHNYIYMCAKDDFSGYHNFADNYRDHVNNARRFRNELNRRKIYR